MDQGGTEPAAKSAPELITAFRAWRIRRRLSVHEAARRLAIPYTVVRGVDNGRVPNLRTAARLVYGSGGELAFEDFLPPEARLMIRRSHGTGGRARSGRRKSRARRSAAS
jgi:hypothetical protein